MFLYLAEERVKLNKDVKAHKLEASLLKEKVKVQQLKAKKKSAKLQLIEPEKKL